MATVERRQQADGPVRYRVRWRDPSGKQKSKSFDRRRDADQWRTHIEHQVLSGAYVDPRAGKITLGSYAAEWRAAQPWSELTAERVASAWRNHIEPAFGDRPIGTIRTSELQAWVSGLAKTHKASTVETFFAYLSSALRAAVVDRVIPASPAEGVVLTRPQAAEVVPPSPEQVQLLIDHAPERWRALVVTLAGLGLRVGEALGLTVDRVDFLRRQVRVDRQAQARKGQGVVLVDRLKTKASYRTIPLPDSVGSALASHLERYGPGPDGAIFHDGGRLIGRGRARSILLGARTAANTAAPKRSTPIPDLIHPHDLRHFYVSMLIERGCSVVVVQRRVGHGQASTTMDTYGHLWPDSDEQTRQAVDDVLGRLVASV